MRDCKHRRGENWVSRGITRRPNGHYQVQMFNKVVRRFETLEEAEEFRDLCLRDMKTAVILKTYKPRCK